MQSQSLKKKVINNTFRRRDHTDSNIATEMLVDFLETILLWKLDLFVMDDTVDSVLAYRNLAEILDDTEVPNVITVIDVSDNPEAGSADHITAYPTVIRRSPPPQVKLVGSLTDSDHVLLALGLKR